MKLENGVITTDPQRIKDEMKSFYEHLYQSKINQRVCPDDFFSSSNIPKLSVNNKESLDIPITKEECFKTLRTFEKNKSPGNDGLTFEFYDKFWCIVSNLLVNSYKQAFAEEELSTS